MGAPERNRAWHRSPLERKRSTVYLPWFWRAIMFVVRSLPESVFIRLSL